MPGGEKSRSGCARCKEKKLKCDESRPACNRCVRVKHICPGYGRSLRWSTKHEISRAKRSRKASTLSIAPSPQQLSNSERREAFQGGENALLENTSDAISSVWPDMTIPECTVPDFLHPLQNIAFASQSLDGGPESLWPDEHFYTFKSFDTGILEFDDEDSRASAATIAPNANRDFTVPGARVQTELVSNPNALSPMLVTGKDMLIEFYFRDVAVIYSCYDGDMNPFRSVIATLWSSSALIFKTLQSMAAACLVTELPHMAKEGARLRSEVLEDLNERPNEPDEIALLATIMLGQTAGWHNPHDLGISHYHRAKALLACLEQERTSTFTALLGEGVDFFETAIDYWEMLFAFVTSKYETRVERQGLPRAKLSLLQGIVPHPWALVMPDMLHMIREVGELIWENRAAVHHRRFWSTEDLACCQAAISRAKDVERDLFEYQVPTEGRIVDPGDTTTPVTHLRAICQAYRIVALIQIYRVFPDILEARTQSGEIHKIRTRRDSQTLSTVVPYSMHEREGLLKQLANDALDLTMFIPLESHTRCVQPFLLIALSGEVGPLRATQSSSSVLSTITSRRFIQGRLESFRRLLPPKPAQCRVDLVLEIWKRLDASGANVYWLDVVIEKDWHFLFG